MSKNRFSLRNRMLTSIDRYKLSSWFNKERMAPMFGIKVHLRGADGWFNLAENGEACLFENEKDARAKIANMKKEAKEVA